MKMNKNWVGEIFLKIVPDYRSRWMIYEDILSSFINKDTVWLDIGCGRNELVAAYGSRAHDAIGIDIIDSNDRSNAPFLCADIKSIPLSSEFATLITLRMVVEHLENIPEDFSEVIRLLKPGGRLIILTTNSLSPIIILPRLLPYSIKKWLIRKIYHTKDEDIFKTFHRFNTPLKMKTGIPGLSLQRIIYIEQVQLDNPVLALINGIWYVIVKITFFRYFSSNLLAVFEKTV